MSLQATVVKEILYTAATYGAAYDTLRQMTGFEEYEISDSNLTVEWNKAAILWDILADVNNNEQIGLWLGRDVQFSMLGMIGFMIQSSKTVEEGISVYCDYGYMICPMVIMKYKKEQGKGIIELHQNLLWKSTYARNARVGIDFNISGMISYFRQLTGRQLVPLAVELEHSRGGADVYEEVLGTKVSFNAPLYRIIFREEDMQLPVISSDASLYGMFQNILAQKKTLFMQDSCTQSLKNLLFMQFKGQIPTVEEAAEHMNMTVRTLQRKLMDEQTSYRAIANKVKKELAMQLIKNAKPTDVAEVMGYADLPSFRRAFKGWTNTTPREVKRKIKAEVFL